MNYLFFINRIVLKTRAQIREHFNIFSVENFRSFGEKTIYSIKVSFSKSNVFQVIIFTYTILFSLEPYLRRPF